MKLWEHNDLAEDLANIKETGFLDVPLGSSYANDHKVQRADVITVKPSYSRFCITIYEVKISKADFLSDIRTEKWKGYLPHCHRFYFAVPAGMVKKEEIPEGAGLIYRADNGWNTQIAPKPRDIEISQETLLSLLFSKQREQYQYKKRNRLNAVYDYSKREDTYKFHGKELGEALRNFDEYKKKKTEYEHFVRRVRRDIESVLGVNLEYPDMAEWDLHDLVEEILERSKGA